MAGAILFESLSVNLYFHHLFRMGLHLKACRWWCVCDDWYCRMHVTPVQVCCRRCNPAHAHSIQASLVCMLYDKMLKLSSAVKGEMGVGAIVNLQSNDAAKIWALPQYMHVLWSGPFQVGLPMQCQ